MKTRLIFVRHAEAEGNVKRIFHGWYNSNLTERGEEQAKLVAERLKDVNIDVLYSSVLNRTFKTASYIAEQKKLPIITSANLKEINGGDWEDVKWTEIAKRWPEVHDIWENKPGKLQMPNGESMVNFQQRVLKEVYRIIKENEGKTICIVTHGTVIKALQCKFSEMSLEEMQNVPWCENTAVTFVDYDSDMDEFTVKAYGDDTHLPFEMKTIAHQDWWQNLYGEDNRI